MGSVLEFEFRGAKDKKEDSGQWLLVIQDDRDAYIAQLDDGFSSSFVASDLVAHLSCARVYPLW